MFSYNKDDTWIWHAIIFHWENVSGRAFSTAVCLDPATKLEQIAAEAETTGRRRAVQSDLGQSIVGILFCLSRGRFLGAGKASGSRQATNTCLSAGRRPWIAVVCYRRLVWLCWPFTHKWVIVGLSTTKVHWHSHSVCPSVCLSRIVRVSGTVN